SALERERPGLILLDLKMPVMNGREFLHELHQDARYAAIPVVVVTSLDTDDPELAGIPQEVRAVLNKGPGLEEALPYLLRALLRI
ncbi:MAG TPA: response regulator, partial [Gemmatimonadales bacterium]